MPAPFGTDTDKEITKIAERRCNNMTANNQKKAAADKRQQQKEKLKRALEKYGIPREVYIDKPSR